MSSYGGGQFHMGDSDNGNQKGGHNAGQNNYYTITFFFQGKVTFKENSFHFYIINFKRTYVNCNLAEKLYSEQRRIFYFYVACYYDFLKTHL